MQVLLCLGCNGICNAVLLFHDITPQCFLTVVAPAVARPLAYVCMVCTRHLSGTCRLSWTVSAMP